MTCANCIHHSLCDYNTNISGNGKVRLVYSDGAEIKCSFFESRTDVVEVVRCRDCVKKDTPNCAMWYDCEKCKGQWSWCNPNDYCSYGERRENGT